MTKLLACLSLACGYGLPFVAVGVATFSMVAQTVVGTDTFWDQAWRNGGFAVGFAAMLVIVWKQAQYGREDNGKVVAAINELVKEHQKWREDTLTSQPLVAIPGKRHEQAGGHGS